MEIDNIITRMKESGLMVPAEMVRFRIPQSEKVFDYFMSEFLKRRNEKYVKLPSYEKITKWLSDNEGRGLYLHGMCGIGKSFIGRYVIPSILHTYCRLNVKCMSMTEANRDIDKALGYKLLSLDDLGTEGDSNVYGNKRHAFDEIIDSAERDGKLLIVTTNLTPEEVTSRYGERVMDRIKSTTCRVLMKGKSFRK